VRSSNKCMKCTHNCTHIFLVHPCNILLVSRIQSAWSKPKNDATELLTPDPRTDTFSPYRTAPIVPGPMIVEASRWHTTLGRTPLDEWSALCRDFYLITHNTHKTQASMTLGWIRTRNPSKRAASDPSFRTRSHRDRLEYVEGLRKPEEGTRLSEHVRWNQSRHEINLWPTTSHFLKADRLTKPYISLRSLQNLLALYEFTATLNTWMTLSHPNHPDN